MSAAVVALLCRTSDRTSGGARGAQALAELLADRLGETARMVGTAGTPAARDYTDDLRDSRGCLLEAGGQVEDALAADRFPALFKLIGGLGKPSLCAANGHVLAGALGLALACDLIVAREGVRFGTPEINVGVFPFMIMALIYRNVGRKKTNELLLLGERVDAHEAQRLGLVNRVVAADEFDAAVADWAGRLAAKSPVLMRLGKDAMHRQQDMAFADALEYLRLSLTLAFSTQDIQEGVKAFFEQREPKWTGR